MASARSLGLECSWSFEIWLSMASRLSQLIHLRVGRPSDTHSKNSFESVDETSGSESQPLVSPARCLPSPFGRARKSDVRGYLSLSSCTCPDRGICSDYGHRCDQLGGRLFCGISLDDVGTCCRNISRLKSLLLLCRRGFAEKDVTSVTVAQENVIVEAHVRRSTNLPRLVFGNGEAEQAACSLRRHCAHSCITITSPHA